VDGTGGKRWPGGRGGGGGWWSGGSSYEYIVQAVPLPATGCKLHRRCAGSGGLGGSPYGYRARRAVLSQRIGSPSGMVETPRLGDEGGLVTLIEMRLNGIFCVLPKQRPALWQSRAYSLQESPDIILIRFFAKHARSGRSLTCTGL